MASNYMYVCLDCRIGGKNPYPKCEAEGHRVKSFGTRITVPKKNNSRAWKRIERGEILWDRRKSRFKQRYVRSPRRGARGPDTVTQVKREEEWIFITPSWSIFDSGPRWVKRMRSVPGTERTVSNYYRKPDVDLGG